MVDEDVRMLLTRIQAEPEALEPRLVYADLLAERGDPRGELIQIQCQLAGSGVSNNALQQRADEILRAHQAGWLHGGESLLFGVTWDRGFVRSVRAAPSWVGRNLEIICEAEPFFDGLAIVQSRGLSFATIIAQHDALARMHELDLTEYRVLPPELQQIINSQQLRNLESFSLVFTAYDRPWDVNITAALFRDLIQNPALAQLKSLRISQCGLDDRCVELLAEAPLKLESVSLLGEHRMTGAGVSVLSKMRGLRELRLAPVADLTHETREALTTHIEDVLFDQVP